MVAVESYVLVDPITGRVLEKQSPSFQNRRIEPARQAIFESSNRDSDLPLYQPQQRRVPAPEYYAMDGSTPIYKIFKRNPYGRWNQIKKNLVKTLRPCQIAQKFPSNYNSNLIWKKFGDVKLVWELNQIPNLSNFFSSNRNIIIKILKTYDLFYEFSSFLSLIYYIDLRMSWIIGVWIRIRICQ